MANAKPANLGKVTPPVAPKVDTTKVPEVSDKKDLKVGDRYKSKGKLYEVKKITAKGLPISQVVGEV